MTVQATSTYDKLRNGYTETCNWIKDAAQPRLSSISEKSSSAMAKASSAWNSFKSYICSWCTAGKSLGKAVLLKGKEVAAKVPKEVWVVSGFALVVLGVTYAVSKNDIPQGNTNVKKTFKDPQTGELKEIKDPEKTT